MTTAAILVQTPSSRAKSLWLGGLDVVLLPGTSYGRYGVLLGSVTVIEQGPGGVDSMTFDLEDPSLVITLAEGMPVLFWDHVKDRPNFNGFVQGWGVRTVGVHRIYTVRCVGRQALLDWLIVPGVTFPAGLDTNAAIGHLCGTAYGIGVPLPANMGTTSNGQVGTDKSVGALNTSLSTSITITAGRTLRQALAQVSAVAYAASVIGGVDLFVPFTVHVNLWGGLEVTTNGGPGDGSTLTVTDTTAGSQNAEGLNHDTDAIGVYHRVYVKGGNAAATGMVTDGSGLPGPTGYITDTTITTQADRDTLGLGWLSQRTAKTRGSFTLSDYAPPLSLILANAQLVLTDAQTGATGSYRVATIRKTFNGVRENWQVSYGGLRPSGTRLLRRLTRDQLN